MSKPLIELITCECGDWEVLRMNLGEDYEFAGHNIPNYAWMDLLNKLGYEIEEVEISDEDMERNNY